MRKQSLTRVLWLGALLASAAGCTVNQTETPSLTGPSEFALSVAVTASPDTLTQDGGATSNIVVSAFGPYGEPKPGVTFKLDMFVGGSPVIGYGTLSQKTVVTDNNGRATAVYTAPAASGGNLGTCSSLPGSCITITATPVGTNFVADATRQVQIHLVPSATIVPPGGVTPVAAFSYSPSPAHVNAQVLFNGSGSRAGTGHSIVGYRWDWGDGDTPQTHAESTEDHDFLGVGNYLVTLTVFDEVGQQSSVSTLVAVNP
jgi:PKD repeat protein